MDSKNGKINAAQTALDFIKPGMIIGLGTGSTSAFFIKALSLLVKDGLKIKAVASSISSYLLASSLGIKMVEDREVEMLDLTVDGADEIDQNKQMIKGGGGALLREKILASISREMIVIADETKKVTHLGKFPLPVEIASFAYKATLKQLEAHGFFPSLRKKEGNLFYTDNGNLIADLKFQGLIKDPEMENRKLKSIPGVLETGLFLNMAKKVIIGHADGSVEII
ncbi:MAG TPA: ribose-5-phosphate isomerase RpiA [Parachlamydiaceae bacterium]|nr:ribose-5-phosphate isomerase RpiA [Parachlamydiaceae bacterium]